MSCPVVVEKVGGNRGVYGRDVSGCIATGETPEETLKRYVDVLEMYPYGQAGDGLPFSEPVLRKEHIGSPPTALT